jgi:hypothetical protein
VIPVAYHERQTGRHGVGGWSAARWVVVVAIVVAIAVAILLFIAYGGGSGGGSGGGY